MADQKYREDLERQIRELQKSSEEANQRAKAANQRAEAANQRAEAANQRAEQAVQPTTFAEYLAKCHDLVFSRLRVETDRTLTTKGTITKPDNKYCPTYLVKWDDIFRSQRDVLGRLLDRLDLHNRAFERVVTLEDLGKRVQQKPIASEKDLEYFLDNSITHPVRFIVDHLVSVPEVNQYFNMGKGIRFENNFSNLSDTAEEVQERRAAAPPPPPSTPSTPKPKPMSIDSNQVRADQICRWLGNGEGSKNQPHILYVTEYKPPHKITVQQLRAGLCEMNIYEDVVIQSKIPNGPIKKFEYRSKQLVASAISQTFHYMIESGIEYGIMTTGEAFVFLNLDLSDRTTLRYHLSEPAEEVKDKKVKGDTDEWIYCTAVAQVLAFSLMALEGRQKHGQDTRHLAKEDLKTWDKNPDEILKSMTPEERKLPPESPGYEPETYSEVDRTPRPSRILTRRKAKQGTASPVHKKPKEEPSDDEDNKGSSLATRTPTGGRAQGENRGLTTRGLDGPRCSGAGAGGASDADGEPIGPYCTQACLLGLAGQARLDERCPNVALHRRQGDGVHHPVNGDAFLALLRQQLKLTLDDGIEPLFRGGARGVLFRVALRVHGYVLVAKGTVPEFIVDLKHEAAVYARLRPVQGADVPVCLGAVDLRAVGRTYYYDHRVYIRYMLFLSWGGEHLQAAAPPAGPGDLHGRLLRSLRSLHAHGVVHRDFRAPNVLFCRETGQVMIIDFERALLVDLPRPPLVSTTHNKRKRPVPGSRADGKIVSRDYATVIEPLMQQEVGAVQGIITELGISST